MVPYAGLSFSTFEHIKKFLLNKLNRLWVYNIILVVKIWTCKLIIEISNYSQLLLIIMIKNKL